MYVCVSSRDFAFEAAQSLGGVWFVGIHIGRGGDSLRLRGKVENGFSV